MEIYDMRKRGTDDAGIPVLSGGIANISVLDIGMCSGPAGGPIIAVQLDTGYTLEIPGLELSEIVKGRVDGYDS